MSQIKDGRILFIDGAFHRIGLDLIKSASKSEVINIELEHIVDYVEGKKGIHPIAFSYGSIPVSKYNTIIHMFYLYGNLKLDQGIEIFLKEAKDNNILGFIILIDATHLDPNDPYDQPRIINALEYLKEVADMSKCLFVILNADQPGIPTIEEICHLFKIEDVSRAIPCITQDYDSTKNVLLRMIQNLESNVINDIFIDVIKDL